MLLSLPKPLAFLVIGVSVVCNTGNAFAQEDELEPPVPLRAAPDELSGHFILAPKLSYLVPMGSAEQRFSQRGYIQSGPAAGLDLAFGISRYVAIQARFDYGKFGSGNDCPSGGTCEATSMAFGAGVDYHLVNGAAFDPWMRAGIGYRIMRYDLAWSGTQTELEYSGLEWLHLAVGGEWYPHSMFGVGPYMSMDLGSYGTRPEQGVPRSSGTSESAIHAFFSIGLRGVFDPQR